MNAGEQWLSEAAGRASDRTQWWWLATRACGAVATLAVGAVHLQQYFKLYSSVPTIGTLFVLGVAVEQCVRRRKRDRGGEADRRRRQRVR